MSASSRRTKRVGGFPEHKPLDMLLDQKRIMTEASWQAEYQQRPLLVGSGAIPIEKLKAVPFFDRSNVVATVMSVDKAIAARSRAALRTVG
jgi:hypothetical protein